MTGQKAGGDNQSQRAVGDLPGLELAGVYVGLDMVARK